MQFKNAQVGNVLTVTEYIISIIKLGKTRGALIKLINKTSLTNISTYKLQRLKLTNQNLCKPEEIKQFGSEVLYF